MTTLVVIETFLNLTLADKFWPESITANEIFRKQIDQRKLLLDRLSYVTSRLPRPDISLETAIEKGYIDEKQAAELYSSLSDLLESEPEYRRIILYLPFEFLPAKTWQPSSRTLRQASDRFKKAYIKAWQRLLWVQDIRANFVDGDVSGGEQRFVELPHVVKAAHLIPKLVENGLLETKDMVRLMEESSDQVLKNSVADAFPVLADLGLISKEDIKLMERSRDWLINNMARAINAGINAKNEKVRTATDAITFSFIREKLAKEFSRIDTAQYGSITEKRKKWLKQIEKEKAIEDLAETISTEIIENRISSESLKGFFDQETNTASAQALIGGIRKAIEFAASTDPDKGLKIYGQYRYALLKLWEYDNILINEALLKTFRHLYYLKIIDGKQLAKLNIVLPELAGPFSKNLKLIGQEMRDIEDMIRLIESDPELARLIYPIVLAFGSRIKGYGAQNSDLDLALFVRPGISFSDRTKLEKLLEKIFVREKFPDRIVEFWLEEKNDTLRIRDFAETDVWLGESYWTHALFGSVWIGKEKIIRELIKKLLVPYLCDTGKISHGLNARDLYLEELERDSLLYRLMQKGYEKFFPQFGGIKTLHTKEIDGESMFYDSGFRQLATKLFITRVFLPKIPDPKTKE